MTTASTERSGPPYADPPATPPALAECRFYHSMELPGLGLQEGQWDLRPGVDAYLGPVDYEGRRVLDVGTANGFVCFELERRGADVVAVELPEGMAYDARPTVLAHAKGQGQADELAGIRNAYWLAHHVFESRARVVYAHANDIPEAVGRFDVVFLGNVLQHVRDPAEVLLAAGRFADTVVVTEADWMSGRYDDLAGLVFFVGAHPFSWFQVKPPFLTELFGEMGFDDVRIDRHTQLRLDLLDYASGEPTPDAPGTAIPHFTVTARRTSRTTS